MMLAGVMVASAALGLCACNDKEFFEEQFNPSVNYGEIKDERDGQVYKTVKIGDQTWMAENLKFEYKVDGKTYGVFTEDSMKAYGYYYTWAAAMDGAGVFGTNGKGCGIGKCSPKYPVRGICPEGWHLPDKDEWEKLTRNDSSLYGEQPFRGASIISKAAISNSTNASGFSVLNSGYYKKNYDLIYFCRDKGTAYFWTSSVENAKMDGRYHDFAYYWYLKDKPRLAQVEGSTDAINPKAYSVRCLKDESAEKQSKFDKVSESKSTTAESVEKQSQSDKVIEPKSTTAESAEKQSQSDKVSEPKSTTAESYNDKEYKTVKIGAQVWMAENLNISADGSYCYDDDPDNCNKYGRLYTWNAAQMICPNGWHLPSSNDWKSLEQADIAGDAFNVQTAGFRNSKGKYELLGKRDDLWSSDAEGDKGKYWYFSKNKIAGNKYSKDGAMSVRCIKD